MILLRVVLLSANTCFSPALNSGAQSSMLRRMRARNVFALTPCSVAMSTVVIVPAARCAFVAVALTLAGVLRGAAASLAGAFVVRVAAVRCLRCFALSAAVAFVAVVAAGVVVFAFVIVMYLCCHRFDILNIVSVADRVNSNLALNVEAVIHERGDCHLNCIRFDHDI